ncbi:PINIT domain-containing protein [Radiomyces spectabilis]|uniref:PINIT domain-containing protein n=1 Tax=Radiomyces spectabilis TaxID=64574 RepID=UPI00221F652D|nr:PINIT domain-containing protein [Radiomyces spectabilis]KAI8388796.1 PINIT domain-containing protein [Radiomyces spectabilis]
MDTNSHLTVIEPLLTRLRVVDLKELIREINAQGYRLTITGVKHALIDRVLEFFEKLNLQHKEREIQTVLPSLNKHAGLLVHHVCYQNHRFYRMIDLPHEALTNMHANDEARTDPSSLLPKSTLLQSPPSTAIQYKDSPFYEIKEKIAGPKYCPKAVNSRNSASFVFSFNNAQRSLLNEAPADDNRPLYQIRFFCSEHASNFQGANLNTKHVIEFPGLCEIKVNGHIIPSSAYRGLKNRPGTVNPLDVTNMIYIDRANQLELTYANTARNFVATVQLVKRHPIASLINLLKEKQWLSKENVLAKLEAQNADDDIVLDSETISTKCPLGFTRIVTPCRPSACHHIQCFDATNFLSMNEQTPTWSCPVCSRKLESFQDLVVDGYFADILAKMPNDVERVRIEPDGQLRLLDEDLKELPPKVVGVKRENDHEDGYDFQAPNDASVTILEDDGTDEDSNSTHADESIRNDSTQHSDGTDAQRQKTADSPWTPVIENPVSRRAVSEVIDLTSDDEEEANHGVLLNAGQVPELAGSFGQSMPDSSTAAHHNSIPIISPSISNSITDKATKMSPSASILPPPCPSSIPDHSSTIRSTVLPSYSPQPLESSSSSSLSTHMSYSSPTQSSTNPPAHSSIPAQEGFPSFSSSLPSSPASTSSLPLVSAHDLSLPLPTSNGIITTSSTSAPTLPSISTSWLSGITDAPFNSLSESSATNSNPSSSPPSVHPSLQSSNIFPSPPSIAQPYNSSILYQK